MKNPILLTQLLMKSPHPVKKETKLKHKIYLSRQRFPSHFKHKTRLMLLNDLLMV